MLSEGIGSGDTDENSRLDDIMRSCEIGDPGISDPPLLLDCFRVRKGGISMGFKSRLDVEAPAVLAKSRSVALMCSSQDTALITDNPLFFINGDPAVPRKSCKAILILF